MSDIKVTVLFCDDVRHEIGGKISAVGIYRGFLGIRQPVRTIPKIVALVLLDYPPSACGRTLTLRVCDRDETMAENRIDLDKAPPFELPPAAAAAGVRDTVRGTVPIELLGLSPVSGMKLRVELQCDGLNYTSEELVVFVEDA